MKDWDQFWYQNLLPHRLLSGATNHLSVDLSPSSTDWKAAGHHGTWNLRTLMEPREFCIRLFSDERYKGTCRVEKVSGILRKDGGPPYIRNVRAGADQVPCFSKFELTFDIPDRYPDPFDPEEVLVTASFENPAGEVAKVDGFYGLGYYSQTDASGDHLIMQGPPVWRVRFCPVEEGKYKYTLTVRDRYGECKWGPATFAATAANSHGFCRVSKTDPRYFESSDGAPFFPIGYNVRSPFDTRMDGQFPWVKRWPEGYTAYMRYFKNMQEHGENFAEVWTSAWSLGLEWTPMWAGYHGIGQFNMMNAWQLDKVLEEAERRDIHLNLVIHNHGKFSTWSDEEWKFNPFNVENGGYLEIPEEYFTDPRALKSYVKLVRYMISRWAYSTSIFAWELWSELNLTGSKKDDVENYRRPEVVEWHKNMGAAIKEMDPFDHLVSTHVSSDYNCQNRDIVKLQEIDFSAVDAYHGSPDALHIVELIRQTANFNNPFKKPVLITEFGGSPTAQGVKHLRESLHAALWASTCTPIGGTPLFWWWQLVEEENFYPEYTAISKFMAGEDLRDPDLQMNRPEVQSRTGIELSAQCLRSKTRGFGWLYRQRDFASVDPAGMAITSNVVMRIDGMAGGAYRVQFWDTLEGKPIAEVEASAEAGTLTVDAPPFARDIAFKIKRRD